MSERALELTGLALGYEGRRVVEGIDLAVGRREFVAVLGASGSGKSSLLRAVAGLLDPLAGRIAIAGREVFGDGRERVPAERRGVGMVFQDHALFEHMTVRENVAFGLARREAAGRVEAMLELVGLVGLAERRPHELSGGQRQRVALARALAPRPALLLLDEPFANLDAPLRSELATELRQLLGRAEAAALLVTHDREEALGLADRVAVIAGEDAAGPARLAQVGTPEEVYLRPASPECARLTGEGVVIEAELEGESARTLVGAFALHADAPGAGGTARVLLRPEDLDFERDERGPCRVLERRFLGRGWRLVLESAAGVLAADVAGPPPSAGTRGRVVARGPCQAWPRERR